MKIFIEDTRTDMNKVIIQVTESQLKIMIRQNDTYI